MDRRSLGFGTLSVAGASLALVLGLSPTAGGGSFPLTGMTSISYSDPIDGSITPTGPNSVATNGSSTLAGLGTSYSDNYNQPFAAGSIVYSNGGANGIPSQVTLQLATDYTTASGNRGSASFAFGLDLSQTGNSGVTLSIASLYSSGADVTGDGSTTYLEFLGFSYSNLCNMNLNPTLTANDLSKNSSYLWAEYVIVEPESQNPLTGGGGPDPCPSVPEPTAWLLGLMGGGLLPVFRRMQ